MARHEFYTNVDGSRDDNHLDGDHHNGPSCRVCGSSFCIHCQPERVDEECDGPDRDTYILISVRRSPTGRAEDPEINHSRWTVIPSTKIDDDPSMVERLLRDAMDTILEEWRNTYPRDAEES